MTTFDHKALSLQADRPLVYTAMSKHYFCYRMLISRYVLEQGGVPLNPFMVFDYFLADTVDRDLVREGNNNLVRRSDELWMFGPVSDGALAEIKQAKAVRKPVRYFDVKNKQSIVELSAAEVPMEDEVAEFRSEL